VVFTDIYPGGGGATGQIGSRIASILFPPGDSAADAARALARRVCDGHARGTIDRTLFTSSADDYFTGEVLADYAASLGLRGAPTDFLARGQSLRGRMAIRSYVYRAGGGLLSLTMMILPDGRIERHVVERGGQGSNLPTDPAV